MILLPDLPFAEDALEPRMSARTVRLHHGEHHRSYVDTTNALIEGTALADASIEEIVRKSHGGDADLANAAGQVYSHNLFWQSLNPTGGGAPPEKLAQRLTDRFGSVEAFGRAFVEAGTGQFGSGWIWLVLRGGELDIMATSNADTPIARGAEPLLVCDVWEHAYYLDYENRRPEFLESFIHRIVNWDLAARRLAALANMSGT